MIMRRNTITTDAEMWGVAAMIFAVGLYLMYGGV